MHWIFDNERPIYIQLVEELKALIISGYYHPGEKLPSVREFAKETQVNPNTIARALQELESQGLIYTKRTSGKYITESEEKVERDRQRLAEEKVLQFLNDMRNLGFTEEEVRHFMNKMRKEEK